MKNLSEKTVLITGGSRGIGRGLVEYFSANSKTVYYTSRNKCLEYPVKNIQHIQCDHSSSESVKACCALLEGFAASDGGIDVLINNVGMAQISPFENIERDDWIKMFDVNLFSGMALSKTVVPWMKKEQWGRIINIASVAGQRWGVMQLHYAASKAALINATISLSRLYASYGITVNCIAPGQILTDMMDNEISIKGMDEILRAIPCGKMGSIEDVVHSVKYLSSDDASFVTGQVLGVNGGSFP